MATALVKVYLQPKLLKKYNAGKIAKGDVLAVAQVAGVMGAKDPRVDSDVPSDLPLGDRYLVQGRAAARSRGTLFDHGDGHSQDERADGVEMEAMTAVSVAALTIYDMCKAIDRAMSFSDVWLLSKAGGKSGTYTR